MPSTASSDKTGGPQRRRSLVVNGQDHSLASSPSGGGAAREYCFCDLTVDRRRGLLFRGQAQIKLRPQAYDLLCFLVDNPGRLVSRDELYDAIWGDKVVTDGSLTHCLMEVRSAIGDRSKRIIRTVPRRGYIFEPEPNRRVAERRGRNASSTVGAVGAAGLLLAIAAAGALPGWLG